MAVGARRRGNPTSGKGQKAGTVRRSSGPGDHDFGRGGTGTGRPDDDRFGGQVTEMVRRRSGELGAGIISSEMGAVTSQSGWMLRQLSGAESTRSLLSEPSSPEFRVTRTFSTHHADEPREERPSGLPTGTEHRGAGTRTPWA